jgi:isochorismate pyruvate lyase
MTTNRTPAEDCPTMAEVRRGVDEIDSEIVRLIAERFRYMDAAARIKPARETVRDEARKAEVLDKVTSRAGADGAPPEVVADLYERLIEASIAYELERFDALRTKV